MSDILVRIPLSGQSDFHPLALAPGLPMLDARKLTFQVLLGWFGDLLAEPVLDDEGVTFYVQKDGHRQAVRHCSLATAEDLSGVLAGDLERLKKALFDVRPVSPSERLIFNRLQPPIGKIDGFLYRVRADGSSTDQLVWCWGFQRRVSDGAPTLCPNRNCARLFLQHDADGTCPACGVERTAGEIKERRSWFPFSAAVAAVILVGLTGGTYWLAANAGKEIPVETLQLATLQEDSDNDPVSGNPASGGESDAGSRGREAAATREAATTTEPDAEVASDDPPIGSNSGDVIDEDRPDKEALPVVAADAEPIRVELPVDPGRSLRNDEPARPDSAATAASSASSPASANDDSDRPQDTVAVSDTDAGNGPVSESDKPSIRPPQLTIELPPLQPVRKSLADVAKSSPQQNLGRLSWHEDYLAAYRDAISRESNLLIVFRSLADPDSVESSNNGLADPELVPVLQKFARLMLPVNAAMPGQQGLLLEHRSFRHLDVNPGIAIVDLSHKGSRNYSRVVSALPLPDNGKYSPEILRGLLTLPSGSIAERSLLLALRVSLPGSGFQSEPSTVLNNLAARNSGLMSQAEQTGQYESDERRQAVTTEFGEDAELIELVFDTAETTTIHEASIQAVRRWLTDQESSAALTGSDIEFGVALSQSSASGRWFATCLIVTNP